MWTNLPQSAISEIVRRIISPLISSSFIFAILLSPRILIAQGPVLPTFASSFTPTSIGPGGISTLNFTIVNLGAIPAGNVSFSNTLPAGITIATPANASCGCDAILTAEPGGSSIEFSEGRLGTGQTFTIHVDVTSSTVGTHMNTTGDLTSSLGNSGTTTADLNVTADRPGFSMAFSPARISMGQNTRITYTVDNTQNVSGALNLNFTHVLPVGMKFAKPANLSPGCTSTIPLSIGTNSLSLIDGSVDSESQCTISIDVTTDRAGIFKSSTQELLSGNSQISSGKATAELIVDRDFLIKSFLNDPVAPGDVVELQFTLTNFDRFTTTSNISFDDIIDQSLAGLVHVGTLSTGTCNGNLAENVAGTLSYSGGSLAPAASCSFIVQIQVPETAERGSYENTTSSVNYDADGDQVTGNPASDQLIVETAPRITKTFMDDPFVAPGNSVVLEFSITNTSLSDPMTDIAFTDDFDAVLPTASIIPIAGSCGPSSIFTFIPLSNPQSSSSTPARLTLTGGSLDPGATCTFSIELDVLSGAPGGTYPNTTSEVSATIEGETVIGLPASNNLTIVAAPVLTKSFSRSQVAAGDTVTLTFTLFNSTDAPGPASNIAFIDDLTVMMAGLAPEVGFMSMMDVCGLGSMLELTVGNTLSFSGGSLAAGESCSFSVVLDVPASAIPGPYINITSEITADIFGLTTSSGPATDNLEVPSLTLDKDFLDNPPIVPGDEVSLNFTLTNYTGSSINNIAFIDDLESTLTGLQLSSIGSNDCGGSITGLSLIDFSGGSIGPNSSCTISLQLLVPDPSPNGNYPNTTTEVTAMLNGSPITTAPAKDFLAIFDTRVPPMASATSTVLNCAANSALVQLNGSSSVTFNPPITSFVWSENGSTIASGVTATVNLGLGQHIIKLTVIDDFGTDDVDITVVVDNQDNQTPTIACPEDAILDVGANCQISLLDYTSSATANDNCTPNPEVTQSPAPGTLLSGHGTSQLVTLTADDGNGNIAQCSFTVSLQDNTAPGITCPVTVSTMRSTNPGLCTYTVQGSEFNATATDNCALLSLTYTVSGETSSSGTSLSGLQLIRGTNTVTWTAIDVAGNITSCSFIVEVEDDQNPTDYIIYATEEAKFPENNYIGGDVGVTDADGKADFEKDVVLDPYKVIAADIKVKTPSQVTNQILSPAADGPTPPFYPYNGSTSGLSNTDITVNNTVLNGSWKDVKVKKNITATMTGNNFGKITIEEGATVTFTAGTINMEELDVKKGKKDESVTTVIFTNPTYVKVEDKVTVDRDTRVNENGPKVTFYVDSDKEFKVEGENSHLTANVMIPDGKLKIGNADAAKPVVMTGWYIMDKLDGGKYTYWNQYDCSGTPSTAPAMNIELEAHDIPQVEATKHEIKNDFDVKVFPNPSSSNFRIQLFSESNEPVTLRVVELTGRQVSFKTNLLADTAFELGEQLPAGTYFAEMVQGSNRKTVKLIKLN
ncbi:MAG: T9SS type A sorting domain-containing protein [Saprospiraceae bacterium]|nr:T9SS type A sorting domain-containing protein [Saprospiraceae bacterium]